MRTASIERKTKETDIKLQLNLDGGEVLITTGIGFFDHMLTAFAVHSNIGLVIEAIGDTYIDCHHTIEDVGIVLGKAFDKALANKGNIERYGNFSIPMDEALTTANIDISGRPFLVFNAEFPQQTSANFDYCMVEEFFRAFAYNSKITMHINMAYGKNSHHIAESIFKAVAHSMKQAVKISNTNIPLSTKGSID